MYIVAEDIDDKTKTMCKYLNKNGIDISCITINFFEQNEKKIVRTDTVVGTKDRKNVDNTKQKSRKWDERLSDADPENRKIITEFIDQVKKKYSFVGRIKYAWYCFYKKKSNREIFVVAIMPGINTCRIAFRINPESFNIKSESIRSSAGWFFPKGEEYRINLNKNNLDTIWKCLDHVYEKV